MCSAVSVSCCVTKCILTYSNHVPCILDDSTIVHDLKCKLLSPFYQPMSSHILGIHLFLIDKYCKQPFISVLSIHFGEFVGRGVGDGAFYSLLLNMS